MPRRSALALLLLLACRPAAEPATAGPPDAPTAGPAATLGADEIAAIVADPARSAEERALDAGRKPAELLAFLELRPGMQVAEISAGGGYTTFLLARAVGPQGRVYAQNNRFLRERMIEPAWSERLKTPAFANVVRVDRELDDPLPPEARDLDLVVDVLFYHDTYWMGTDRARMNAAVLAALRPGGSYVIVDHSALPGAGDTATRTLHRVEEKLVRAELEAAGFLFAASGEFLRNPDDARDWNAMPSAAEAAGRRGTADRFVLRYIKPEG